VNLSPAPVVSSESVRLHVPIARSIAPAAAEPVRTREEAERLHALDFAAVGLWRANQLDPPRKGATSTGFSALDAELPGGGWPHRELTEMLLPHPGLGELRLLVPALSRIAGLDDATSSSARSVMLFDPPASLCGWALAQLGVNAQQLLVVYGREGARGAATLRRMLPSADLLWALEQALKSGHVGAVLTWLPQRLKAEALRRLQLAAQAHDGPVFLFREVEARAKPSAAPLRLLLQGAGIDRLSVRVLKRRGPPLTHPLELPLPRVLSERLRLRAEAKALAVVAAPQQLQHVEASW
jgi:protein ImuA